MNTFEKPQLSDRAWINDILKNQNILNCDAPFGTVFTWQEEYGTRICHYKDFYLIAYTYEKDWIYFDYPIGNGDVKDAINFMIDYAVSNGLKYTIVASGEEQANVLRQLLPHNEYEESTSRDNAEYIYLSEKLAYLAGRKFHSKRNHIAKFKKNYNYSTEILTKDNFVDALYVNNKWCLERGGHKGSGETSESCAMLKAFRNFDQLGFSGMVLKIDGKPVAMTMGEELNKNCYIVHFEKAISGVEGAYTAINNFFSATLTDYKYINREEDMGIEGLRKAKLSYKPDILLEKYVFVKKED